MTLRRTVLLVPALGLSLLIGVACSGGSTPAAPAGGSAQATPAAKPAAKQVAAGDATRGKQLFSQSCVSCHGPDAKGLPGLGKDMTTSTFIKGQTDPQLVDFVKKGRPVSDPANTTKVDMPSKGGNPALNDAQLADIVAFIRSVQK